MLRVAVVVKNNYISYISYISHISTLGGPDFAARSISSSAPPLPPCLPNSSLPPPSGLAFESLRPLSSPLKCFMAHASHLPREKRFGETRRKKMSPTVSSVQSAIV